MGPRILRDPYPPPGMTRRAGLGVLLMLGVLALAAPARAGTYSVYACKKPDGSPAPTESWTAAVNGGAVSTASCAQGGSMHAELSAAAAHNPGEYGDLVYTAPSGVPIVGYVLYRHAATTAGTFVDGNGVTQTYHYNYDLLE